MARQLKHHRKSAHSLKRRSLALLVLLLLPSLSSATLYYTWRSVGLFDSPEAACFAMTKTTYTLYVFDYATYNEPGVYQLSCMGHHPGLPHSIVAFVEWHSIADECSTVNDEGKCEHKQPEAPCSFKDPIVITTGNSYQTEVDYQSQSPFGLSFIRYYNSIAYTFDATTISHTNRTKIGIKWRHNYDSSIEAFSSNAFVHRSTGQSFNFNYDGTDWMGDVDISDTLVELKDAGNNRTGWQYTTANDNVEIYNLSGQLIYIANRQGQAKVFSYDIAVADGGDDNNSTLDKVTGFNNEVISFTYSALRIASMTDPQGNVYLYHYDAKGNLQAVTYPDSTATDDSDNPSRIYHYENTTFPHHLTGITDETGSRVTWQFDSQGRAISNELDGGVDRGTLVYHEDDSVTTTDTLGKQTTYHFTTLHGVKKVTQVEGHASASCVAANKNYTYDANGYLQSKTDWQNKVTTYIHDARGLETSRTEADGTTEARTITTDWHATFRLPIKITEPGKVTDYSYDAQGRLTSQTSRTL